MKKSKKVFVIWLPALSAIFILLTAFSYFGSGTSNTPPPDDNLVIPENINNIFDKSCFGCHNTESKNDKAKEKFLIDKLPGLSKVKMVSKLDKINEMVEKNEMPPEKFLAKFPDKALTPEEAKALREWAVATSDLLLKK
jgi:hypothetical protein